MITRLMGNSLFIFIKILFKERIIKQSVNLNRSARNLKICYKVIGIRPEADSLAKKIASHSNCVQVFGFNGFTERLPSNLVDQNASMIIHGRKLSNGEIGCARSHQLAYLASPNSDWTIFLEDDVIVDGELSGIEKQLSRLSSKPSVVFLNFGSDGIVRYPFWRKKQGTYAYALNKSAIDLINHNYSEIMCVADWPIQWIYQIKLYVLNQQPIRLNQDIDSLIDSERKESKRQGWIAMASKESSIAPNRVNMISLYGLLKRKKVKNAALTAFCASKTGLYSGGRE